ncbi:hypothetical protein [Corallibacter sp.]|uniref:hypothetical protein n=1 Tax=Corallibacter sp. TaxID=2038084 RepID=UPI003AB32DAD
MIKSIYIVALLFLTTDSANSCECICPDDCSFSVVYNSRSFVALIKVVSYVDYLDEGKTPYSMKVEIKKKYMGEKTKDTIKIWGDNGQECRPYISHFKIGDYYLIAPKQIGYHKLKNEEPKGYEFFSCSTDYLKVDIENEKAYGNYSRKKSKIKLSDFEEEMNK